MKIEIGTTIVAIVAVVSGMMFAQPLQPNVPQLNDALRKRIEFALRWAAYWEPHSMTKYTPGAVIPLKIVESPNELAVILSRIRTSVVFRRSPTGTLDRLAGVGGLSQLGNETLDSDVRDYIRMNTVRVDPDKVDRLRKAHQGTQSPNARSFDTSHFAYLTPLTGPESFSISDGEIHLPRLTPPEYIIRRIKPAGVDQLVATITQTTRTYMASDWKPATVVIPYFSAGDPAINVLVNCHQRDFSEGVFWVTPNADGNGWSVGKLTLNRGSENLKPLIRKLVDVKLIEFAVSPK